MRPSVLIVEPDAHRRHELGNGLASEGYEVVPAGDVDEGVRFAQGLGPAVIVASAHLAHFGDASVLAELTRQPGGIERTLVLLGEREEDETAVDAEEVVFLATGELAPKELIRRLRLVLIGREIGLVPDGRLEALVGDLSQKPLFELVRALEGTRIHARVELEGGSIEFEQGEIVGASAGRADGVKGFCRLARRSEAPFRVRVLEEPPSALSLTDRRRIEIGLDALVDAAIQDSMGQFPAGLSRLEANNGAETGDLGSLEQQVLQAARQGVSVQEVFDALDATDGEVAHAILELEGRGLLTRRDPATVVRIVTDSTSDLPNELAQRHGITVLPLKLRLGRKVYRDRVDLLPNDFYRILEQKVAEPEMENLTPEEIQEVYGRVTPHGDVLALHVTKRLAETHQRASEAAVSLLGEHRLEIIDSNQIGMGLGLQALFASRLAMRGFDLDAILEHLERIRPRLVSYTVLDTVDYLVQGKRVGKLQGMMQGLLDIKPILSLDQGDIVLIDKARGQQAALPRLLELFASSLEGDRGVVLAITHANAPERAEALRAALEERHQALEVVVTEAGSVIGAHVGPGTFGAVAFQPTDDELQLLAPLD